METLSASEWRCKHSQELCREAKALRIQVAFLQIDPEYCVSLNFPLFSYSIPPSYPPHCMKENYGKVKN